MAQLSMLSLGSSEECRLWISVVESMKDTQHIAFLVPGMVGVAR